MWQLIVMSDFTLTEVFLIWIVGFGTLSYMLREKVAGILLRSKLPSIVNYYIILTPLVLIEEFLTCEIQPYLSCIRVTLIAFYILFIPLYFIQRFTRIGHVGMSVLFGLIGWLNEFILVGRIHELSLPIIILFTALVIPIYAVLAILPCYYLEKSLSSQASSLSKRICSS